MSYQDKAKLLEWNPYKCFIDVELITPPLKHRSVSPRSCVDNGQHFFYAICMAIPEYSFLLKVQYPFSKSIDLFDLSFFLI